MALVLPFMVPVRAFLGWWGEQLASLLPKGSRGPDGGGVALVELLAGTPVSVALPLPRRGRQPVERQVLMLDEVGPSGLRSALGTVRKVRVRVPVGLLLHRDVVLPLAAERAPEQVVRYQFDQLTPFNEAETFWSCAVTRRDKAQGKLHVRLTLALRAPLLPLLDSLRAAGVTPVLLESPPTPGQGSDWRRIVLEASRGATQRRPALRLGLALCGALAVAVVVVPFVRQSLVLASAAARIDALQPQVSVATALRQHLAAAAAGGDVVEAERQKLGDPLSAIAAVTEALPDDTFVTDLTLNQRRLALNGQSVDAVRLIPRLTGEFAIRNPAFTAPVTRASGGHGDVFAISAELVP
jgi:general secretion pathway protein L